MFQVVSLTNNFQSINYIGCSNLYTTLEDVERVACDLAEKNTNGKVMSYETCEIECINKEDIDNRYFTDIILKNNIIKMYIGKITGNFSCIIDNYQMIIEVDVVTGS